MYFSDIKYLNEQFEVISGHIVTQDDLIVYVDSAAPPEEFLTGQSVYNGTDRLLMPALYNAHAHVPMTLLRGYADGLPLDAWLNDKVFPFEAKITDEAAYWATQLGVAEMLRFGTASVSDMYDHSEQCIKAYTETGFKANVARGVLCFDDSAYSDLPAAAENEYLYQNYHNSANGRIKLDLNIHAEYTSNPQVVQSIGDLAVQWGLITHIHASETQKEQVECKERRGGLSPIQYFDSQNFFRQPCLAAHCVWTDAADWEIMQSKGVSAVINPSSNLKLASGIAPVSAMLKSGVSLALGTDGAASNNSSNLFKELYLLSTLYNMPELDSQAVSAQAALKIATVNGAKAQGRADCGLIKVGYKADLTVLDTSAPHWHPQHNLRSNLVYSAQGSDCMLTMVDGQVLYRDGEYTTLDIEQVKAKVAEHTQQIVKSL